MCASADTPSGAVTPLFGQGTGFDTGHLTAQPALDEGQDRDNAPVQTSGEKTQPAFGTKMTQAPIPVTGTSGTSPSFLLFLRRVGKSGIVGVAWSHLTKSGPMKRPPRRRALATCRQ